MLSRKTSFTHFTSAPAIKQPGLPDINTALFTCDYQTLLSSPAREEYTTIPANPAYKACANQTVINPLKISIMLTSSEYHGFTTVIA